MLLLGEQAFAQRHPKFRRLISSNSFAMTLVRIIAGLIHVLLRVVASVLTSGIGLLVTAVTIVLVVAALGIGGVSGFGAVRMIRKRRHLPPPK